MKIKALFMDLGGVLLTNGWDRNSRKKAAEVFKINGTELDERHHLAFDAYECGKMNLDEYLKMVVFYEMRTFTVDAFKDFMFSQSKPIQPMLDFIEEMKQKHALKVVAVSNEGREISDYRIKNFQLKKAIDFFVISGYVGLRKPDPQIFRLALDLAQFDPKEVIYVDDRSLFVEIAKSFEMEGIWHQDIDKTKKQIEDKVNG